MTIVKHSFFSPSVQFSSVAQSCLTLCNPMNRSKSGLPVYHQLPEFTQTPCPHICSLSASLFLPCELVHLHHFSRSEMCVNVHCFSLFDPMNSSTPAFPVQHHLPEFTQTHIHRVSDAIQPSHPLSSPSPPAPNPSQHQGLFQ